MVRVRRSTAEDARQWEDSLVEVLRDTVDGGASIGFLPPLKEDEAREYWRSVFDALQSGGRVLLLAENDTGVVGSVQLGLEPRANGRHRAEVMKLMVHRKARGMGVGKALMAKAHSEARELGRTLLVLDTRRGDTAEQLYCKLGYREAGVIPEYARSASGELHDTVFMYLKLA